MREYHKSYKLPTVSSKNCQQEDCLKFADVSQVIFSRSVNTIGGCVCSEWVLVQLQLPYSREQKHISISDTPMLLIEINSISNMGCQK